MIIRVRRIFKFQETQNKRNGRENKGYRLIENRRKKKEEKERRKMKIVEGKETRKLKEIIKRKGGKRR